MVDATALDRDIGAITGMPRTVDHCAVANEKVVHQTLLRVREGGPLRLANPRRSRIGAGVRLAQTRHLTRRGTRSFRPLATPSFMSRKNGTPPDSHPLPNFHDNTW